MTTDITTTEVQEIWFKAQRWLRTLVQTGFPAFLTFALVLPQIIAALGLPVTSKLYVWLIGAAAFITAVAAGLSRVMAIPAVNVFLVKFGLGSVPKLPAASGDVSSLPEAVTVPAEAVQAADQTPAPADAIVAAPVADPSLSTPVA